MPHADSMGTCHGRTGMRPDLGSRLSVHSCSGLGARYTERDAAQRGATSMSNEPGRTGTGPDPGAWLAAHTGSVRAARRTETGQHTWAHSSEPRSVSGTRASWHEGQARGHVRPHRQSIQDPGSLAPYVARPGPATGHTHLQSALELGALARMARPRPRPGHGRWRPGAGRS